MSDTIKWIYLAHLGYNMWLEPTVDRLGIHGQPGWTEHISASEHLRLSLIHISVGSTCLDYDAFTLTCAGQTQELPQKEFILLYTLLSYQHNIFHRRQLMDEIWDMGSDSDERTVDVHINRLRDRLRGNPDLEIVTVRGLGYKAVRLEPPQR